MSCFAIGKRLTLIIVSSLTYYLVGQNNFNYRIDTFSVKSDGSIFAKVKTFKLGTLTEEMTGYVSNDLVNVSSFRNMFFLKNIMKKYREVIKIKIEGYYVVYTELGKEFNVVIDGKIIQRKYFNKENKEINQDEYFQNRLTVGHNWNGIVLIFK